MNAKFIVKKLLDALEFLINDGFSYDLKIDKFLVDEHMNLKIIDFDFTNEFNSI